MKKIITKHYVVTGRHATTKKGSLQTYLCRCQSIRRSKRAVIVISDSRSQKLIASYRISSRRIAVKQRAMAEVATYQGLPNATRESFSKRSSQILRDSRLRENVAAAGRRGNVECEDTRRECTPRANYRRRRASRAYLYTGGTEPPMCAIKVAAHRAAPRRATPCRSDSR